MEVEVSDEDALEHSSRSGVSKVNSHEDHGSEDILQQSRRWVTLMLPS